MTPTQRITTRRARAAGVERRLGDIEIAQTDQGELTGRRFLRVIVACTLSDIGDPRFRIWLGSTLAPRIEAGGGIQLAIGAAGLALLEADEWPRQVQATPVPLEPDKADKIEDLADLARARGRTFR